MKNAHSSGRTLVSLGAVSSFILAVDWLAPNARAGTLYARSN